MKSAYLIFHANTICICLSSRQQTAGSEIGFGKTLLFLRMTILVLIAVFIYNCTSAQKTKPGKKRFGYISIAATNSHTAMPYGSFSKLFYREIHPGIEIGTGFNWRQKKKHDWLQTVKLGYSYHGFVQRSVMLYTEFGYRYKFPLGISANAKIGAGWLHSKEDTEVFTLNKDGEYIAAKKGRSHPMASFAISVAKQLNKNGWQVFVDYQQRFQLSFIAAYVPALPVNAIAVGVHIPLQKN